jgi:3-dehydroquinate dehydratase-1
MANTVKIKNTIIGEGVPKICIPIIGKTKDEIINSAKELADAPHDLVEWRADFFDDVFDFSKVSEVLAALRDCLSDTPLLFTFRSSNEGGEKSIDVQEYVALNKAVILSNYADLVDVELGMGDDILANLVEVAHLHDVKIIASNHDFEKTPSHDEMIFRLQKMQDIGADIAKLAVMPTTKIDVLNLLAVTEEFKDRYAKVPIVTMSMASMGLISRISGEVFGSSITFGTVGKASAPGQMNASTLNQVLQSLHSSSENGLI